MKLSTLACLAVIGLFAPAPSMAAGQATPAASPAQAQAPASGRTAAAQPQARGSDRRRRSYAACNRASHQRSLQGGRRRRFLIRCKLGYERPRTPPAVQPAAQNPVPAPAQSPAPPPAERKP